MEGWKKGRKKQLDLTISNLQSEIGGEKKKKRGGSVTSEGRRELKERRKREERRIAQRLFDEDVPSTHYFLSRIERGKIRAQKKKKRGEGGVSFIIQLPSNQGGGATSEQEKGAKHTPRKKKTPILLFDERRRVYDGSHSHPVRKGGGRGELTGRRKEKKQQFPSRARQLTDKGERQQRRHLQTLSKREKGLALEKGRRGGGSSKTSTFKDYRRREQK